MAERIDQILEEWKTDFDDEEIKRKELGSYFKILTGQPHKNEDLDLIPNEIPRMSPVKAISAKSEMMNNRPIDDNDDTIFNLEAKLQEKDQKISDRELKSRTRDLYAKQKNVEI